MTNLHSRIQYHLDHTAQPNSLRDLFCQVFNWAVLHGSGQQIVGGEPDNEDVIAMPIAAMSGIPVFRLDWHSDTLPTVTQRRRVQAALSKVALEHLVCYVSQDGTKLAVVWARNRGGKRMELCTLSYEKGTLARTTIERLALLAFSLKELSIVDDVSATTVIDRINQAFDVEAVTRQFFTNYRDHFARTEQQITGIDREARRIFTQKLFNRLMLLVFLERKGWLRFNDRTDYLKALWDAHQQERLHTPDANFFRDRLKPLFFSGLNKPHEINDIAMRIGNVPYLNGGLFEEEADDRNDAIHIPDDALESVITHLFYAFNFSVSESTPFDMEVAVDPEMMGKIFEELVTGRHESGSYYTPRAIVAFMCREGLKGYLAKHLADESQTAIEQFVDEKNAAELQYPEMVLDALKRVRVCDPACGSGAYVLGMLHELLHLRATLLATCNVDAITMYQRKLSIIQHNLYGVDKDPFAVNIARLRLWLSLIIEFDGDTPPPLPNLEYKLESGDSLLSPNPVNGDFDIVVANPPYVRQELIKNIKPALKKMYPEVYTGTSDLYVYFYARALHMLKPDGMLVFISSNKWFRANYGKKLKQHLATHTRIHSITDFGGVPLFATATVDTTIFVAQKSSESGMIAFTQVSSLAPPYPDVLAIIREQHQPLPAESLQGANWLLFNAHTARFLQQMERQGVPLEKYVQGALYRGIITGLNEAFVLDTETRTAIVAQDPSSAKIIKPLAMGKDVRKWHIKNNERWCIVTPVGIDIHKYPVVFAHLQQWQKQLEKRWDKGNHWWELRPCEYYHAFHQPKIVYPIIAKESRFAYDTTGVYTNDKAFIIPLPDLYLLAVLNSSIVWEYLKNMCATLGDAHKAGALELRAIYMSKLPIPPAPQASECRAIENLAQQCINATGQGENRGDWEAEIDARVARLYGLNGDDLKYILDF